VVTDHLGTPIAMVDEVGKLAWKAQLDVFGVVATDVAKTACPWRWPGQYEDEETGLFYNRFRYYDPGAGRYVSQDPIGLMGGLAAFGYVPDPLAWVDPLGLAKFDPTILTDPQLKQKIDDFIRGVRTRPQDGTKGLIHRVREKIFGKSRPGSIGWINHELEILRQQGTLRKALAELERRGIKPPEGAWKVATMPPPTGHEVAVPKTCK